ncbi:MAG: hypothetical protein FGM14_14075 [Flavobacteriales bacterium]|nr:hypothetical protein [Flavobacteriales bacterium]
MPTVKIGCGCTGNGNLGLPSKLCQFGVVTGFALQNRYNSTGAENSIDLNVSAITTAWTSLLTSADTTVRVYPMTGLRQFAMPTADDVNVTDNQGIDEFVRVGDTKFTMEKWNSSPVLTAKINKSRCASNVVYFYTKTGIIGLKDSSNKFTGFPLSIFSAKFEIETGDQPSKTMINGQFDREFNVGDIWFVPFADFNTSYATQRGLIDANFTIVTPAADGGTNTTVGLKIRTDYSQGLTMDSDIVGVIDADLVVTNKTTGLAISGATLLELPSSEYTLTYASATTADVIEVKFLTTVGYEGSITFAQPA